MKKLVQPNQIMSNKITHESKYKRKVPEISSKSILTVCESEHFHIFFKIIIKVVFIIILQTLFNFFPGLALSLFFRFMRTF